MSSLQIVYLAVTAIGVALAVGLLRLYRPDEAIRDTLGPGTEGLKGNAAARPGRFSFGAAELMGFSYGRLFLISVAALFLELLIIRWISSEIRVFAYLKSFVLIACYLGFGLGCFLCRRRIHIAATLLPLLFLTPLADFDHPSLRALLDALPRFLAETSEVHVWGVPQLPPSAGSYARLAAAIVFISFLFALLALMFIPIGQLVGWMLENSPNGIKGYTVNILGSLAGILGYTLLCFIWQPPAVWFAVAGVLLVACWWRRPAARWGALATFLFCFLILLRPMPGGVKEFWSPYQKLMLFEERRPEKPDELFSYHLLTNNIWYQQIIDLSPAFVAKHPDLFSGEPLRFNAYNIPFQFYPNPPSALVLGAGMGNDVAAALRGGAGSVVAVEIDPLILDLGRRFHFEHPYDDPRVETVVNDARSYLQNADEKFDLIVFSLLDSHTNTSHYTNIRIDNYVYTVEALAAARRMLKPDGIFIVKFQADTPWIVGRLRGLMAKTFGREPLQVVGSSTLSTGGHFFIDGSPERIAAALADPALAAFVAAHGTLNTTKARLTTDDWPYFYQHAPGLPLSVLLISLTLVVLSGAGMKWVGARIGSVRWHFFFLGAGFLLLEVQIISRMALLFGTTWIVNSIVIAALLLLIVGANFTVARFPRIPRGASYAGLFATIAAIWLVPTGALFFESFWLKVAVATLFLCLPVFFAGIVFIRSFALAGFSGEALGANLLGALVGGLLESISMWSGMRSLLIVAGVLYLASMVAVKNTTQQSSLII